MLTGKVILYSPGLVSVKLDGLSYVSLNTCKTDERPELVQELGQRQRRRRKERRRGRELPFQP